MINHFEKNNIRSRSKRSYFLLTGQKDHGEVKTAYGKKMKKKIQRLWNFNHIYGVCTFN